MQENQYISNNAALYRGDCCEVIKELPDNSVDFSIYSPPFANLYIYSDDIADMGNCQNDSQFFEQYRYLVREQKRILRPGRLIAVHCKNLVDYRNSNIDGESGQRDFRGEIIRLFKGEGFSYHSEVTIWKDPVIEMQKTKAQGLLHKTLTTNSSYTRNGMAEYLVVFRKWPKTESDHNLVIPIDHKGKINWATNDPMNDANKKASIDKWQQVASPIYNTKSTQEDLIQIIDRLSKENETLAKYAPHELQKNVNFIWRDIRQTNVLNIKQSKSGNDEKHICPLQLDVIEKAIELWTNPNDVVFTPFMGIGSEVYQAVKMGRKGIGIELKESYFNVAVNNCKEAEADLNQATLF